MGLGDTLKRDIEHTLSTKWNVREGKKVPEAESVGLSTSQAVKLDAAVLYADLAASTMLVRNYSHQFCAKVYKTYLAATCKILRQKGASITSFDGDRVMGVFLGDSKNSDAGRCALAINHMVVKILNPAIHDRYPNLKKKGFKLRHGVGIDAGELFAVRTGVRNNNDLAWIGEAANIAAKLSALRRYPKALYLTQKVFSRLRREVKLNKGTSMWTKAESTTGGRTVYQSAYHWAL